MSEEERREKPTDDGRVEQSDSRDNEERGDANPFHCRSDSTPEGDVSAAIELSEKQFEIPARDESVQ